MRRVVSGLLLVAYAALLFWLTLSPNSNTPISWRRRLQLHPLQTIGTYLEVGGWPMLVNLVGNLAAFMPLGFLWPLFLQGQGGRTNVWRVGGLSAVLSLLIEVLQLGSGGRIADVDDLILNTLGGLLGYGVFLGLQRAGLPFVAMSNPFDLVSNPRS